MVLHKKTKATLINEFKKNEHDTGSIEVQIAMLTEDIRFLTEHLKKHAKDFSSKRGLLRKVSRRKSFLGYLEQKDPQKYHDIINRLNLKR